MTRLLLALVVTLTLSAATQAADAPAATPAAAPTKSFVYKTAPAPLELVVHYPPGWTAADKRPVIVFFFGGGWKNGTIKAFEQQAIYLAEHGMVAVRADYRVKSRQPATTPKDCVEDAKSAIRWVRQHAKELGADPDRLVASGGSAGGHIAACSTLTPGLDAAGEDAAISTKANVLVLYNPVTDFMPEQLSTLVGKDESVARAISPTLNLKKDSPPTLLLYGTADRLLAQGQAYMEKCKEIGVRCELFTAEGMGHGFFNKEPWKEKTTARMAEFLTSVGYLPATK